MCAKDKSDLMIFYFWQLYVLISSNPDNEKGRVENKEHANWGGGRQPEGAWGVEEITEILSWSKVTRPDVWLINLKKSLEIKKSKCHFKAAFS